MRGVRRTAREVSQLGQLLFAKMTDTESFRVALKFPAFAGMDRPYDFSFWSERAFPAYAGMTRLDRFGFVHPKLVEPSPVPRSCGDVEVTRDKAGPYGPARGLL